MRDTQGKMNNSEVALESSLKYHVIRERNGECVDLVRENK